MPQRIQLSRRKGWRKPENAIVVARPTRWGNPYKIGDQSAFVGGDPVHGIDDTQPVTATDAVFLYREALEAGHLPISAEYAHTALAGADLACWCPLDQPCHADVLLEIANP